MIRLLASWLLVLTALGIATQAEAQQESLTLERALALAREHSPALAATAAGEQGMESQLRGMRALYGPQVSADVVYLRFQDPPSLVLGPAGSFSPIARNGYLFQLGVLQALYTGGRVGAAVRAAERGGRAAAATHEQTEVELTAAVAHAHDAALLANALLMVAEGGVVVLRSAVAVAEEQHAAGTVARLDVLRAETRLSAAEQEVRTVAEEVALAHDRLAVLIGIDPATAPLASGALEPADLTLDSTQFVALLSLARRNRPDVRALGAGADAARAREQGARATLRPTVSLYAAALGTRPELFTERESWSTDLLGGVVVSWPVFDFGRAAGEAGVARAEAEGFEAEARQVADEAGAAARAALRNLERGRIDIAAGQTNVRRAERALEIAQDRYVERIGIQLEVLEAESDLTRTRAALLRSIHDQRSAAVELRRAIGLPADVPLPSLVEGR